jgi:DNA-binding transcriptional regulator YhcF (GntR family)
MTRRFEGFAVDRQAEVPIGVQLAWALRTRIGDGTLRPGQRLPGLRDLARELGVNLNTVRAVYQRLEHEGLIDSQQGNGTFIASTPRVPSAAGTIAAAAAREAQATGVDPREVAAALYVSAARAERAGELGSRTARATETERRRLLRRQIAALERALGELAAEYPGVTAAPAPTRNRGPALLSAAELTRVRTSLVRRLAEVHAAIDAGEAGEQAQRAGEVAPAPAREPGLGDAAATLRKAAKRGKPATRRKPTGASSRPATAGT